MCMIGEILKKSDEQLVVNQLGYEQMLLEVIA